jgi:hypothetical protein
MAVFAWPMPRVRKPLPRLELSAALLCPAWLIDVKDRLSEFAILIAEKGGGYAC